MRSQMCVMQSEPTMQGEGREKTLALPCHHEVPTLTPASDSSNSSSLSGEQEHDKMFPWRHHHSCRERTTSRSSSNAVTHARTTIPKPPLPVKAVRAMNCVSSHTKTHQQLASQPERPPMPKQRSSLKRSSLKRSSTSSSEVKKVHFGDLELRNYEIVLGDHPDCSSGPPLSIGWEYSPAETMSVDKYEALKPERRSMDELELNYYRRKRMLRRNSLVSDEEMRESIDSVRRIQKQRMHTKRMQPFYKLREAFL